MTTAAAADQLMLDMVDAARLAIATFRYERRMDTAQRMLVDDLEQMIVTRIQEVAARHIQEVAARHLQEAAELDMRDPDNWVPDVHFFSDPGDLSVACGDADWVENASASYGVKPVTCEQCRASAVYLRAEEA